MLDNMLSQLDDALLHGKKSVIKALIEKMQSIIIWQHDEQGSYAVDTTTGIILMSLDNKNRIVYNVCNLPPLCVMFNS